MARYLLGIFGNLMKATVMLLGAALSALDMTQRFFKS
jgi:hypothetical protein